MCKITTLLEVAQHFEPIPIMIVPAVTTYNYRRTDLVHPVTNIKVTDHCFAFKTEVEHEEGQIVTIMDNGSVYGFKLRDVFILLDVWYTANEINNEEHADLCTYFDTWFNTDMPVSALDQITSVCRRFSFNPINWLMFYIHRVDLRGMIPPTWFIGKEQEKMAEWNRQVRENINPVFLAPSPRTVMVDISNVFDDDTVSTVSTVNFDVTDEEVEELLMESVMNDINRGNN